MKSGDITAFVDNYIKNCETGWSLDDGLVTECAFSEWNQLLLDRSGEFRRIFSENEEGFSAICHALEDFEHFPEELCDELYSALERLYLEGYDDLYVMQTFARPLITRYEQNGNFARCIFLYHLLGFENFEFYERIRDSGFPSQSFQYFEKVIALSDHYAKIENPRIRKCIFTAYSNLISPGGQIDDYYKDNIFNTFDEALALWNSPTVQAIDGDNEAISDCIRQIHEDVLFAEDHVLDSPPEFQKRFLKQVEDTERYFAENDGDDEEGTLARAKIKARLLKGEDPQVLIQELIAHIRHLTPPDYTDEQESLLRILDYHNSGCSILDIFPRGNFTREEYDRLLNEFVPVITDIHTHIPMGFWISAMNNTCTEWFREVRPFLRGEKTKREMLIKLIISRQPITYIHSLMVSRIARRICCSLCETDPDFFVGMPGFADRDAVIRKKDELIAFSSDCGLLHDVGKCAITEVINRQNRRISDEEFAVIKLHPEMSQVILGNDEDFADYYDVMKGHHKSYDGKSGYPADFDNNASPMKPMISLISIADCCDAATDILGRNYTRGKDFCALFEELKKGAGTRYDPAIVNLIQNDRDLYRDLSILTKEKRKDIYYQAYQKIIMR